MLLAKCYYQGLKHGFSSKPPVELESSCSQAYICPLYFLTIEEMYLLHLKVTWCSLVSSDTLLIIWSSQRLIMGPSQIFKSPKPFQSLVLTSPVREAETSRSGCSTAVFLTFMNKTDCCFMLQDCVVYYAGRENQNIAVSKF